MADHEKRDAFSQVKEDAERVTLERLRLTLDRKKAARAEEEKHQARLDNASEAEVVENESPKSKK